MNCHRLFCLPLLVLGTLGPLAWAVDPLQPSIAVSGGRFLASKDHESLVTTEVTVPLFAVEPLRLRYQHRQVTPIWEETSQTQLFHTRHEVRADLRLNDSLGAILVGGYRHTDQQDRPGSLGAAVAGIGLGSLPGAQPPRLEWQLLAGGFMLRDDLEANWWCDGQLSWRALAFGQQQMLDLKYQTWLGLGAEFETANHDSHIRGQYQIGPFLEAFTANGNHARLSASWYFGDGNPFYEDRESGLLVSLQIQSSLDKEALFNAAARRPRGWMPLVWGEYDLGWGGDRTLQRTALEAEVQDMVIGGRLITGRVSYESRQEYNRGDYDNTSYTFAAGAQSAIGLGSVLSQDQPLVLGADYLHRSAHALDPDTDRVAPGDSLSRNNINVCPRLRLQTQGWDLPYRDPSIYKGPARWLHQVDWRLTIGYSFNSSRHRSQPSMQAGLNWEIASVGHSVFYARAIGSASNETPDWLFEAGVRRQTGKIFLRAERYGLESHLAKGNLLVAGFGVYL